MHFVLGFLGFLLAGLGIYILIRNGHVYNERQRILGICSKQAKDCIRNGNHNWRSYYDFFDHHSYNEMVFKFWKPVKSFYKEPNSAEL
uniref:Uncharacterized protein n=1 Tax=viral metagenome TaxID=1070528 RepID=A0A6M3J341_9ZZZZ